MKMYFLCEGSQDWWTCTGILDNGFQFGGHVCSHPNYAPSDLYLGRKNRIKALKELFDIDPETVEKHLVVIKSKEDIPAFYYETDTAEVHEKLKPLYEKYELLCGDGKQESRVEMVITETDETGAPLS